MRSLVASVTPSTTSPFSKSLASVPATVVATRTVAFHLSPLASASTYDLFAASVDAVGVPTLVILLLARETSPEKTAPFGAM